MENLPEILLVDKPVGKTSFDVIRILRRKLGVKKMGHAGTLDPLASGLMIIGLGAGTKRLSDFVKLDKEYLAEILIGEKRSTGDMEGIVLSEKTVTKTGKEIHDLVYSALENMIGELSLPVSAYSAIKVAGVPMYRQARLAERIGELVTEVPMRVMKVYEAQLFKIELKPGRAVATVKFAVGSGTYIRSLAEELGNRLGYPATLYSLRRIKVGQFDIEMAKSLDDI
jgi:tRNA pseudouridine55 synthase